MSTTHSSSSSKNSDNAAPVTMTMTMRMLMLGKEVGCIIGKKGENVKKLREESGARINISDSSCLERIITVRATRQQLVCAFSMICRRIEQDLQMQLNVTTRQLVTLRLIVPGNQCGSLIGKGGANIKAIRQAAGASIQIAADVLVNSTERLVVISGSVDAVIRAIFHISDVMIQFPGKGATIRYRPMACSQQQQQQPLIGYVMSCDGQMYAVNLPQTYAVIPTHSSTSSDQVVPCALSISPQYCAEVDSCCTAVQQTTVDLVLPNHQVGSVIGRAGTKINDIRQISGANIKISENKEDTDRRRMSISGSPEAVRTAQQLLTANLEAAQSNVVTHVAVDLCGPTSTTDFTATHAHSTTNIDSTSISSRTAAVVETQSVIMMPANATPPLPYHTAAASILPAMANCSLLGYVDLVGHQPVPPSLLASQSCLTTKIRSLPLANSKFTPY